MGVGERTVAISGIFGRFTRWLRGLNKPALAVLFLAVLGALGTAGYFGYRAYDYIEHDNEFCLTCHLMAEPYERFAQSAHRDLGCKSCHKPTFIGRSRMALTQIIENPDVLEEHAEVANSKCEGCHVKGDPEKWEQIANTAGHRVHLESKDPALKDVKCVECHSSNVHEFAATEKTCAQGGCHENVEIRLGKMSRLTLHCALCHDFKRDVPREDVPTDSLQHALAPNAEECLSCHQMRRLVADEFTGADPHEAQCALCHNPHKQATPQQALQSCATGGCHSQADTLTPMHRGLPEGGLAQCTQCHQAHKFEAPTNGCLGCHQDIFNDAPAGPVTRASPRPQAARQQPTPQRNFSHARHRQVSCQSCHNSTQQHGVLTVRTARDCQSCHHGAQAVAGQCGTCHQAGEYAAKTYPVAQNMTFSVGQRARARTISFDHRKHEGVSCAQCHRDPLTRSATPIQCNACHEDHHKPTANCMACHTQTRAAVHPPEKVHVTCAGSGCHSTLPVEGVPRTRELCLTCHQQLTNHRPNGNCADCHRLPAARR